MCFSFPWGRVSVVQNRPSRPAKLASCFSLLILPSRILHASQPKCPMRQTALLFSHCVAPVWSPYFGVCMSILSKPANRALFISLHSQLVLIQHQFDATPSAPFLQFRARRAASRTQIPNSSSKDHAFTFMQRISCSRCCVNSPNSHPHPWQA